jgi:type IV secretory pathway VirB6-like protein
VKAIREYIDARRVAQLAIVGLLLALVRTLAEYYRLRHVRGQALTLDEVGRYVTGGLIAALGIGVSMIAYFVARYRLAASIVGATIVAMLVYKVVVIGPTP